MKRSQPLRRGKPLKRTQWTRKSTRPQPGWTKAVKQVKERSGNRCEIRTSACIGIGQQTHHRLRRSQGGKADVAILARCCNPCDSYLSTHVAEAYERGWLIRSWDT